MSCQKIYQFDANKDNFGTINKAIFYNLNPDYIQISGDKALMIQISKNKKLTIADSGVIHQT